MKKAGICAGILTVLTVAYALYAVWMTWGEKLLYLDSRLGRWLASTWKLSWLVFCLLLIVDTVLILAALRVRRKTKAS